MSKDNSQKDEESSIKNADWRLQAVTTLANDWVSPWTGTKHEKGCSVMLSGKAKFGIKTLNFLIPSMTALFLDYSNDLWMQSQSVLQDESAFKARVSKHISKSVVFPTSDDKLFRLFEKRMASIVFAYSALEAFANEYIPDNYVFQKERGDKKCTESYTKEQIENIISMDHKIGTILPEILTVSSPKGTALWERYLILKSLRDRIVHMKSNDRKSVSIDDGSIWQDLTNRRLPNFSKEAKDIIGYLLSKKDRPRWFNKCSIN